ncbi:MAG: sugar nucleotide-binding protein [Patescibacteria group bacterium]|jgi:dTDP-4-dehydrorhamnose reductase
MKQKILVTGASGYVGARIYSDLKSDFDVVGVYNRTKLFPELEQLDITDLSATLAKVEQIKPDWIVHIAADPNHTSCEADPEKAIKLNEGGTNNIAEAANKTGAKVVYISSVAAMTGVDLYGKTKRHGEKFIEDVKAGWAILRPSLIVGFSPNTTNDRPFNRFLKALAGEAPAVYDNSWKFQPSYLGHISEVIAQIIKRNITGEIIPITIPHLTTRYDLAKDILIPFGVEVSSKDAGDTTPVVEFDQAELKKLGLPVYTYDEMISRIVIETKKGLEI